MIQPQPIYYPLYTDRDKFIILITGGRGSGKSFNASTFIERLTFEMTPAEKLAHQILYTRYTMVSANISIIPEFLEKVDLDGTQKYFRSTKTDVVNRMTDSHIMFRGIKTSSGNQTAKLKSIHGITTFVCDEAEEWTSEKDFETIMLSIRQKGIQNRIIIIMNPTDNNHWVYKRFIEKTHKIVYYDGVPVQISTHPNVLHIHTTYLDNKNNLSKEFLDEVQDMKINNPEKYAHTVIGQWADVAEGAVFKHVHECDLFPEWVDKLAIGLDFGYSCFSGDTLITTKRGQVPIKDVIIGDYVLTRRGYKRVRNNLFNGIKEIERKEIDFGATKTIISSTPDHKFNINGIWKKYKELTKRDTLYVLSPLMGKNIEDTLMGNTPIITTTNTKRTAKNIKYSCIMQSLNTIMAKSLTVALFIIKTIIHSITISQTLWPSLRANILNCTLKASRLMRPKSMQVRYGTQKKIGTNGEKRLKRSLSPKYGHANVAEQNSPQQTRINAFVQKDATINGNMLRQKTMLKWFVNIAEKLSWEINTLSQKPVQTDAHICSLGVQNIKLLKREKCAVYDLEIEGVHEYFANGLLVHNCDPTFAVLCGIYKKELYMKELFCQTGMRSSDIAKALRPYDLPVFCDSADPRTIDEIHLGGVNAYPVHKYPGSIIAGIEKMNDMDLFVTKSSYNLITEFRKYVWDKDKDGNQINVPVDAYNHGIDAVRYYVLERVLGHKNY